jgi:hypothetical protein
MLLAMSQPSYASSLESSRPASLRLKRRDLLVALGDSPLPVLTAYLRLLLRRLLLPVVLRGFRDFLRLAATVITCHIDLPFGHGRQKQSALQHCNQVREPSQSRVKRVSLAKMGTFAWRLGHSFILKSTGFGFRKAINAGFSSHVLQSLVLFEPQKYRACTRLLDSEHSLAQAFDVHRSPFFDDVE